MQELRLRMTAAIYSIPIDIAPWEEEGHKCKNNISGTLVIKALKEASKFTNIQSHPNTMRAYRRLPLAAFACLLAG